MHKPRSGRKKRTSSERMDEKKRQASKYESELREFSKRHESAKKDLERVRDLTDKLELKLQDMKQDIKEYDYRIVQNVAAIKGLVREYNTLRGETSVVLNELEGRKKWKIFSFKIPPIEGERKVQGTKRGSMKRQAGENKERLDELVALMDKKEAENLRYKESRDELKHDLKEGKKELEFLKAELENLKGLKTEFRLLSNASSGLLEETRKKLEKMQQISEFKKEFF